MTSPKTSWPSSASPSLTWCRPWRSTSPPWVTATACSPPDSAQPMTPGKLGGAVSEEEGYAAARQCALNALAAIKTQVGALSAVKRVVKVVVFVASEPGFSAQPKIANGASEFLGEVFGARNPDSHQVLICAARRQVIVFLWAAGPDQGGRHADPYRELQP